MISVSQKGNFAKLTGYFEKLKESAKLGDLDKYAKRGVEALANATPVDTGLTAKSWYYTISNKNGVAKITFCNSNIQNGVPIAIILQYGHATNNGGWVQGRDYINPVIRPLFDEITQSAWKEVTKA